MAESALAALIEKGAGHFERGDFRRACACYEKAIAEASETGDIEHELAALDALAVTLGSLGEPLRAAHVTVHLLERAEDARRHDYEMIAALRLADALADLDLAAHWHEIQPLLLRSLATAQWMGDRFYEVYCLFKLGDYAVRLKRPGQERLREAMDAIVPGMESEHWFRGEIYAALSRLMRQQENHAEAVRYAAMALGQAQLRGRPDMIAEMQLVCAEAEAARGDAAEALRLAEEACGVAEKHGWRGLRQQAEQLCGVLERESGHMMRAEAATRRALDLARALGLKRQEVECLLTLAQILWELRQREEAREALDLASQLSRQRADAELLARVAQVGQELR